MRLTLDHLAAVALAAAAVLTIAMFGLNRAGVRSLTVYLFAFLLLVAILSLALGITLLLLTVTLILGLRLLLLLGMILEVLLEQLAVVASVGMIGVEFERAVVGADRLLQLAGLGERVTAIVIAVCSVERCKRIRGATEVTRAILRGATPLLVLE